MDATSNFSAILISGSHLEDRQSKGFEIAAAIFTVPREKLNTYPSFFQVSPAEDSKSGQITINQIRELKRQISLTALSGRDKVVLIHPADKVTMEAQNTLLKTLEEPPAHTTLILTTAHPDLLLTTIVSRCQQIRLFKKTAADNRDEKHPPLDDLLAKNAGERLAWTEANKALLTTKDGALSLLDSWLATLRQLLLAETNREATQKLAGATERGMAIRKILTETNADPRLGIETFLVDL